MEFFLLKNHLSYSQFLIGSIPLYQKLFLQEEAAVYEVLGSVIRLAVAHRMIGEVYTNMGQYGKALKHQMKHLGMTFEFYPLHVSSVPTVA
jgi:flavorubredoxin